MPFLGSVIINKGVCEVSHSPVLQIFLNSLVSFSVFFHSFFFIIPTLPLLITEIESISSDLGLFHAHSFPSFLLAVSVANVLLVVIMLPISMSQAYGWGKIHIFYCWIYRKVQQSSTMNLKVAQGTAKMQNSAKISCQHAPIYIFPQDIKTM